MKSALTNTSAHLNRLKTAIFKRFSLNNVPDWIMENTFIRGERFSFENHEFQLQILLDQSREIAVRKCSQVGMSELAARRSLAMSNILPGFTTIFTLPTASFANTFVKTRIDPVIDGSPALSMAIHNVTNNSEVKRFGESFIYYKGTKGSAAAISIPADALIHDELDFSDLEVVTNYQSRLTHSKHKMKINLSTPTAAGYGISALFDSSRRHYNFCKCNHCNHLFVPDYFQHIKMKNFSGDMRDITKDTIQRYNLASAHLECPNCGKEPSLQVEHRQWVVENQNDNYETAGYQISPFDAPNIISVKDLITASTKYSRYADFINFNLGLPAEDSETSMGLEEINRCFVPGEFPEAYTAVMGIDMGLQCHLMVGYIDYEGILYTVHTEIIPLRQLETRKRELQIKHRVRLTVMDSQPYTDILMRFQETDSNLYGALYVVTKNLDTHRVKTKEEMAEKGQEELRQVDINRNHTLDAVMETIKSGKWVCKEDENKETIKAHLQDMKRIQDFGNDNEMHYVWKKSAKGNDHFHHALLYLWVASRMVGMSHTSIVIPQMAYTFKNKGLYNG
ncbi:phage terminase large subunit family protein [Methylotenera sp.]|uniref:phage terminase large subunit family protein n=1 Tax=Methylotenera sp. TaxID=2051956 RepID=UPI0024897BF2|nr:phage terminase large subunit family protein [Methylotenera sp.]MDI1362524.1 phage terminase large subunit family protein [Methylotenera sp.]